VLPVAIEIAPPQASREAVTVLLAACTRAVDETECMLAADATQGSSAVAIVTWQSQNRVFVEVGTRRGGRSLWRSRSVQFRAADEPGERWKTLGFAIGTLARSDNTEPARESREDPNATAEPAPPEKPKPRPAAEPQKPKPYQSQPGESGVERPSATSRRVAIDLGASSGPGIGAWRLGGVLRVRWPVHSAFSLLGGGEFSRARYSDYALTSDWFVAHAGVARFVGSEHWEFGLAADVRGQYFRSQIVAAESVDQGGRWLPGFGLSTSACWFPWSQFGLFVSGNAAWFAGVTHVKVRGELVGKDQPIRFGVDAGVRLRL